ncbi:MAG: hypothetical protein IPP51_03805 [Bacteroidetes bacterium]|nr:hypothetical protein [Bacteroidota bacterium]
MMKYFIHCPNVVQSPIFARGNALLKTRAYYKLINPNIDYDDYYTCIQSGVVYRKKEDVQQFCNLYPNPTSGLVFVAYSVSSDATLKSQMLSGKYWLLKN